MATLSVGGQERVVAWGLKRGYIVILIEGGRTPPRAQAACPPINTALGEADRRPAPPRARSLALPADAPRVAPIANLIKSHHKIGLDEYFFK